MAIDIRNLATQAFKTAKSLAPQAFESVTLRLGPDTEVDPVEDTETTTWATTVNNLTVLRYDEENRRIDVPVEEELKNWLVDVQDLPNDLLSDLSQNGEIEDGDEVVWEVYKAETDPTKSIVIFHSRRGKTLPSK